MPARSDAAKIGATHSKLSLVGRVALSRGNFYTYLCACGNYKAIRSHSQVVSGKFIQCSGCSIASTIDTKFGKFLLDCQESNSSRGYDLSTITKEDWLNSNVKVVCPRFGETTVSVHGLRNGRGCFKCGSYKAGAKRAISQEDYILECLESHPDKQYDYTGTLYRGIEDTVDVYCNEGKHVFTQCAWEHKNGAGCNICTTGGFRKERTAVIYVSSWGNFLKCGITNSFADKRKCKQEKCSGLQGELVFVSSRLDGSAVHDIEHKVKNTFQRGVVSEDIFPDGFSETYRTGDKDKIIHLVQELIKERDNK